MQTVCSNITFKKTLREQEKLGTGEKAPLKSRKVEGRDLIQPQDLRIDDVKFSLLILHSYIETQNETINNKTIESYSVFKRNKFNIRNYMDKCKNYVK